MPKMTIEKLNQLYSESEQVDSAFFSEQRSNVLLTIGEHYNKKGSRFWNRIRDARALSEEQKVRITKNHIQKIVKSYVNNIVHYAPGVMPVPKNEKELSDVKAAQLNRAVWDDITEKFDLKAQQYEDAQDFITLGEVAMKIFWDENAGQFLGWEAEMDEMGQPVLDESGEMVASKKPVYSGDFVFERVYGFNLLRAKEAKTMRENHLWIIRKMADIEEMKARVAGDPEKEAMLKSSEDKTYMVFSGTSTNYQKTDKQVMIKEFYYKPCYEYPNGYYWITTDLGILFEGELPLGIWPIIYTGFDSAQTNPRHYSIIKPLRPYQIEVNRAGSKIVETQLSLGDDKLITQAGAKISSGTTLPGVRHIQVSGAAPTILQGRTGDQYLGYINATIEEMYKVANIVEDSQEAMKQADPMGMLFFSMRDKKKFSIYAEKFERYQIEKCKLVLKLAKAYYDESKIIPAIGRNEIVNIAEFKNSNDLCVEIKLKPMSDDIETMFGKQLIMNQVIQYVGNQLDKEDIGKIIKNMPFGNADESFSDLTLDYDAATNMILALDRGEQPEISPYDSHKYMIKRLVARTRQSDFRFLDPMIQQNYMGMIKMYEMQEAELQKQVMEAQAGFIPSGGAKVKVDFYVSDPQNPNKVSRATLPAEAVDWLIKRLAQQGTSQEGLRQQQLGVLADLSEQVTGPPAFKGPVQTQQVPPPMISAEANA